MSQIHIEVSDVINAPQDAIYAVIADYRGSHNDILPKAYFKRMTVVQGGQGAGTVADVAMEVMGKKFDYHLIVSEPEPGRVLAETDEAAGIFTTFTLEPLDGGQRTRVTIASDMRLSGGFVGFMERLMNPSITRRIYREELHNLEAYMQQKTELVAYPQA
ncbi:MAG: SRPBCC family protein [Anaerolineae bacterium]|nr:SRPBCC family protein [Anaerolineae bacterium]